ncbi:MAG: hypothetical protein F4Z83_14685 [Gemmatimonadetes bacterium]|nr:hypothetical protein [Gemmatimonadota bacterium]
MLGDTLRLKAVAFDANGHMVAGAAFTWSSSDAPVARVDRSGLVRGAGEGVATITATAGSAKGTAQITVRNPDRAALEALYHATDGPNWVNSENWLTDAPLRTWYGVDTDRSGRVVRLDLSGQWDSEAHADIPHGLSGPIPPELGNLSNLSELNLGFNRLTGPIPPELGNLASLTRLALKSNQLTGPIPSELGNLANLTWLSVEANGLTGPIPSELGSLSNLLALNLGFNRLSGPIPSELGNLANLAVLSVRINQLWGPIPLELGNLANLEWLSVDFNSLSGPLPRSFPDLSEMGSFEFGNNAGLCAPGIADFAEWGRVMGTFEGPFCNEVDTGVLESLFEAAGGSGWANAEGWLGGPVLAVWHGVRADSLGRVTGLDLSRNGLDGWLSAGLGALVHMTELKIADNPDLAGRLPLGLTGLSLRTLHYSDTDLCLPATTAFSDWLRTIPSHDGTGVECPPLSDREVLEALYDATGGPNWNDNENWLTAAPLGDWHGVRADREGRVVYLWLFGNNLAGPIPPELGSLEELRFLGLGWNSGISGPIPPELGNLTNLVDLRLFRTALTGAIPPELGNLVELRELHLSSTALTGPIPPEFGRLVNLEFLSLRDNDHAGPIPPEFGKLTALVDLRLYNTNLSGPIPPELGNLTNLTSLSLYDNHLTGPIPPELGNLANARFLSLASNSLSGPVPRELGGLTNVEVLALANNAGLTGALPQSLTGLGRLEELGAGGTGLCAPTDLAFQTWLDGVFKRRIASCVAGNRPAAYLVQAVQSRTFPVPLVAGEKALLRVFPTARQATNVGIPAVRARFYLNGQETHMENIPGKSSPIPTEVDEGSLSKSANAAIPARVIQPGLELVIEVDPEGTLDEELGVAKRIPETGRLEVDVRAMPLFDLTVVPFVWSETQDSSIVDLVEAMAADPENHKMLRYTRALLPVGDLAVSAHEPVLSSTNNSFKLLAQTEAIRAMEGGTGHYMGMMPEPLTGSFGVAVTPGRSSFSGPVGGTVAHELGHNMSLRHAPCGGAAAADPSYPSSDGSIGAWGYDFDYGNLINPMFQDLMSYCGPSWISDYHFSNALRYRLVDEGAPTRAHSGTQSLLLWGGVGADSVPFLEPAFVVDAWPELPRAGGEYRLTGRTGGGEALFSLRFTMPVVADGDGSSSFAFVVPVESGWDGALATITLSGPGGSVTLDADTDLAMTILRNPRNGQVRGILRDMPDPGAAVAFAAGPGLEVLFSRGIPDAAAWRR